MLERFVPVADVLEEMYLVFVRKQSSANRVHRRITPPLVVETAFAVEELKELQSRVVLMSEQV